MLSRLISMMLVGLSAPLIVVAEEPTEAVVGQVGAAVGSYQGSVQAGATGHVQGVSIANGEKHKNPESQGPALSYANLSAGVEVGNAGIAANGALRGGWNFWKRKEGQAVVPHIGIEPFNWQLGLSLGFDKNSHITIPERTAHLEWLPMGSAGVQVFGDTCRAMFSVRGGVSVGTLGENHAKLAYGAGVMGVCKELLLFNADLTRIKDTDRNIDIASVHAALRIPGQNLSIGTVFEGRDSKSVSESSSVYSMPFTASSSGAPELTGKLVVGGAF